MRKTLVTGGAGFIGSHLVDLLVERDHEVIILDDLSSGNKKNINPSPLVSFIEGDVRNEQIVMDTFRQYPTIDSVVHLAAQSKVGPSLKSPQMDLDINVLGTVNVLEQARKHDVANFVISSSAAVYGHVESLPVSEQATPAPLSPYGVSKLSGEEYVKAYGRLYGLDVSVLRFSNVFGPRQSAATEAGVITIFIEQLLAGSAPMIEGDGQQTRDFIYVKDVVSAVANCLDMPDKTSHDRVYNVSTETMTSIEDLLRILCSAVDQPFKPIYREERQGDIKHSYLTNKKLSDAFDWSPQTSLQDGLRETVEYYKSLS
ncbi:NAD-dependent epimerase/dehydratase family protein [Salipaludibacillus sp. HK11]|uniref:NAD-dependent epimerase/dehydratase family protein n=1 Tax=Salipaludibacillus sp. HK11 TaxID=3394320 RepID=UPI0039FD7331